MFFVEPYVFCTLYVCVVSLTYYKHKYPLQYVLFHFLNIHNMIVNDNCIQNIIGHAMQL